MTSLTPPAPAATAAASPHPSSRDRRWTALAVLALIQFMLVLDVTVVNVALGSIQTDLGFSRAELTWVVDGYVLTAGGLLLLGGRLADLLGRRRMFLIGVGVFTLASLTSGLAQSPEMLIASRFAQGAGDALAAPAAFGLIALLFTEPAERAKAIGIFSGVAGLGGTCGPIISGALINASWRWIFFINLPVALVAMVAVSRLVEESRATRTSDTSSPRPDVPGALLATAGLSAVVFGLIRAAEHPWGSSAVLIPLVTGVALLVAFVLQERRCADPLVPLRFFRNRTRVAANVVTVFFSASFFTMFFLLTLYLQNVLAWSPLHTGLGYLPFGVGIGVAIGVATNLVPRAGVRPVLFAGFVLFGGGLALLSFLPVDAGYVTDVLPGLLLMSFGAGLCFAGLGNASVHEVSVDDASLASGVQNAVQSVGGAVGLAVLATLALRHTTGLLDDGIAPGTAQTEGLQVAFRVGVVVMAIGAALVAVLMEKVHPATDGAVH